LQEFSASPEFAHIKPGDSGLFSAHADTEYVRTLLRYVNTGQTMPECTPLTHKNYQDFADRYSPRNYIQPLYNVVVTGNSLQQDFMKDQNVPVPYPLHFLSEWHEIAHGTGAGEPQADMMQLIWRTIRCTARGSVGPLLMPMIILPRRIKNACWV
jgi:hypothetical protein